MYIYDARIRYSEADCENKLTPEGLLNYFQDCSTFHSEDLGLGVKYMLQNNLVWALGSWQIDIERYPEIGERVKVGTLPYDFRGFIGFRNFWLDDKQGKRIAAANSIWTLLDLDTGKPVKPLKEMIEGYRTEPKIEMEYLPRKIVIPEGGEERQSFVITRHYLDTNHHVNNGQYVKMALEYPEEGFAVRRLRAEYKKQAYLDDVFYPVIYRKENVITVSLNQKSGEPYAVVELTGER
ncbi:MAG: acyl-[acyl-carrier-protein] thioesterase [Lachnospiraceae bacterium]|nr:acyl-[acyl-carrier-protein] thioesterase [Lachnospiraceae bacterium]